MINKWILNNFKSINKEKELEFRPLTIFTGANSSGKSTILQSILLVTQTLQNQNPSRSIVLNGGIKKFGSYNDIVNLRDISKDIEIGFCLKDVASDDYFYTRRFGDDLDIVKCNFRISSNGEEENLQPKLLYMKLEAQGKKEKFGILELVRDGKRSEEEKQVVNAISQKYPASDFEFKVITDFKARRYYYENGQNARYIGANLYHFLPHYLIGYYGYKEQLKTFLSDYLMSAKSAYNELEKSDERLLYPVIKDKALEIADEIYNARKYRSENFVKYYEDIKKSFTIRRLQRIFRGSILDGEEKQAYVNQLLEQVNIISQRYSTDRVPMYFHPGVEFVQEFFREHIKYLGPLREEPRSLYPLDGNGSIDDVGLKGENTAAVFENNKNNSIPYISASNFADTANVSLKQKVGTLAEAINEWLIYLGVASDMETNDQGKVGHELKITTDVPNMQQDLTHVGVGVSQVLPILVMSFLAKKGEVIILEQPELHLHPKVQTRLADFFVSMNALGKQCIIETHSEYLINRLRYHVAMADDSKVADDTMIYFVEKENGYSKYRPVTINRYGVIEEWPKGFFDESENIAAQILRAGMEKRMREEGDDEDDE